MIHFQPSPVDCFKVSCTFKHPSFYSCMEGHRFDSCFPASRANYRGRLSRHHPKVEFWNSFSGKGKENFMFFAILK